MIFIFYISWKDQNFDTFLNRQITISVYFYKHHRIYTYLKKQLQNHENVTFTLKIVIRRIEFDLKNKLNIVKIYILQYYVNISTRSM